MSREKLPFHDEASRSRRPALGAGGLSIAGQSGKAWESIGTTSPTGHCNLAASRGSSRKGRPALLEHSAAGSRSGAVR